MRCLSESWMLKREHSFTKTGRMRRAEFGEVAKWVSEAWHSISDKTIVAGFHKAGLIPCAADVESNSSGSEDDSNGPAELQPKIDALFVSHSEEDDFDGFDSSE
ncbi:hypothetical protein HPB51_020428 [Rhipicephalus microplus]|uniref:Uncharacterized protein n=1 Tax=Rhipicephalus microplus TaxID=6941 RepID=A0A9J6DWI9_RHIMP|nr:hypothetical protein HPB51_020428 [Rhipicephalus microplus]